MTFLCVIHYLSIGCDFKIVNCAAAEASTFSLAERVSVIIESDLHLLVKVLSYVRLPLSKDLFEVHEHLVHFTLLCLLLLDLLDLLVIVPPHDCPPFCICHVYESLEILLYVVLVST